MGFLWRPKGRSVWASTAFRRGEAALRVPAPGREPGSVPWEWMAADPKAMPFRARASYPDSRPSASRTTSASAPAAKGEISPAERTRSWKGALPPRAQSAT